MAKREYVEANKRWLEEKAKEEGVMALPRGIYYKVLKQGDPKGAQPSRRSIVTAHYTGWTINGKKFDSSRGGTPFAMRLSDLIDGWIVAMQQMHVGDPVGTLHPSRNGLRQVLAAGHPRRFYPDIRSRTAGCGITRILEIIMIIKTRESCPAIVGSIHLPHCSCRCIFPCVC